jgi:hypothetical protein
MKTLSSGNYFPQVGEMIPTLHHGAKFPMPNRPLELAEDPQLMEKSMSINNFTFLTILFTKIEKCWLEPPTTLLLVKGETSLLLLISPPYSSLPMPTLL